MGVTSAIRRDIADAMQDAVEDVAREVLDHAVADAPPSPPAGEDPNEAVTLREAGYVERVPGGVEVGFRTVYAARQHEQLDLNHPRGGKPKFLESNVAAAAAQLEGRIAGEVRKVTTRGTRTRAPREAGSWRGA